MAEPIKLTIKQIAENAQKYYNEGKLTAQHPDKDARQCANFMPGGYRCAVAASYPPEFETEFFGTIEDAVKLNYVTFDDTLDIARAARIQLAHDMWAQASMFGLEETAKFNEDKFLGQILQWMRSF